MNINLDRKGLEALVRGLSPDYNVMDNELIKKAGSYHGGFVDKWSWNYNLDELTDIELIEIYNICKSFN